MMIVPAGISGVSVVFLTLYGIALIKKIDAEHGLPEKVGTGYIILTAMAGCITFYAFKEFLLLFIIFTSYLAVMAYTDFYVMKLYTIFNVIAAITGYITLFIAGRLSALTLLQIIGIILLMKLFRVINTGDVELLIASVPYLCILAGIYGTNKGYFCFLFMIVVMFIGVVINLKKFITKGENKAPFAVPMFVGYMLIAVFMLFLK